EIYVRISLQREAQLKSRIIEYGGVAAFFDFALPLEAVGLRDGGEADGDRRPEEKWTERDARMAERGAEPAFHRRASRTVSVAIVTHRKSSVQASLEAERQF